MTDEEKVVAVEWALAGFDIELVRESLFEVFHDNWNSFSDSPVGRRPVDGYLNFLRKAESALGEAEFDRFYEEEWQKYGAGFTDPEIWRIYTSGTDEEKEKLKERLADEADKWIQCAREECLREQEQAHPHVKTKAEILLEVVRDFPDATVNELAEAAERSTSWVRRTLKNAGVTLAKPVRQKGVKSNDKYSEEADISYRMAYEQQFYGAQSCK